MPPVPPSAANLFHPKKKGPKARPPKTSSAPSPKRSTPTASTSPQPTKEEQPTLPDGPYTEYRLVSSALNGWKYDVMKFDNRKPVDILTWATPVKLNRKDVRRADATANDVDAPPKAVAPMLGADGKPVIGSDGRVVMVDAEGKPIHAENGTSGKTKGGQGGGRKKFQRKTKQVFKVPDAVRQLRKEERYPWVIEDRSGQEVWVAQMEEASKAETHGFFMPASNYTFKFVPAHRWYKFQKKPNYRIPNLEEAETLMATWNKNKDPERWLLHNRKGQAPSAATSAILKSESSDGPGVGRSMGPGGRRLRTVVNGSQDLFGDDEDEPHRRRNDQDADYDEVPYEEDFADDEEKVNPAEEVDELTKELEERLQQEYMSANKQRDGHIDADDDEDIDLKLSGAGKSMKKLVSKHEKNDVYESDDEGDPYASEEEEEDEEDEAVITNEPAVQQQSTPSRAASRQPSPSISQPPVTPAQPSATSNPASRATSPNPLHGGHSVVAKRATSPKVPKPKAMGASRATSPLAQGATSPRATSPPASSPRPSSNMANGQSSSKSNKRKAEDVEVNGASSPTISNGEHRAKKRKPAPILNADGTPVDLPDEMVVDWLRKNDKVTTRDCITHFTPYLQTPDQKKRFTDLIKKFAVLKDSFLILRTAYRNQGGPPAPGTAMPMDNQ